MIAATELIVDLFSGGGGGGASTGIEAALGRSPNVAINHNAERSSRRSSVGQSGLGGEVERLAA